MEAVGGPQTLLGGAFNWGKGQPGQVAPVSHVGRAVPRPGAGGAGTSSQALRMAPRDVRPLGPSKSVKSAVSACLHGVVSRGYPPAMSTSASPEPESDTAGREFRGGADVNVSSGDVYIHVDPARPRLGPPLSSRRLGVLRIDIHGGWSVADLIKLLGHLEDGYMAAAALEALTDRTPRELPGHPPRSAQEPTYSRLSADELLQTVTAFQLVGGLRLGSVHYGSPGFMDFIGALNPLKTVKDGITENREINRKRDEVRRLDEREREQNAMQHREAMARESRWNEQQRQGHELQVAQLQMEAERTRLDAIVLSSTGCRAPSSQSQQRSFYSASWAAPRQSPMMRGSTGPECWSSLTVIPHPNSLSRAPQGLRAETGVLRDEAALSVSCGPIVVDERVLDGT